MSGLVIAIMFGTVVALAAGSSRRWSVGRYIKFAAVSFLECVVTMTSGPVFWTWRVGFPFPEKRDMTQGYATYAEQHAENGAEAVKAALAPNESIVARATKSNS
jgi:hypothetical protein